MRPWFACGRALRLRLRSSVLVARVVDDFVPPLDRAVAHGVREGAGIGEDQVVVAPIVHYAETLGVALGGQGSANKKATVAAQKRISPALGIFA